MTFTGESGATFLDGAQFANWGPDDPLPLPNTGLLEIGQNEWGTFVGAIDEVVIYDRPLSHDEIRSCASLTLAEAR